VLQALFDLHHCWGDWLVLLLSVLRHLLLLQDLLVVLRQCLVGRLLLAQLLTQHFLIVIYDLLVHNCMLRLVRWPKVLILRGRVLTCALKLVKCALMVALK